MICTENFVYHFISAIAGTQPQAAYAAFTHGLQSRWVYLSRVAPDIADLLQPVENVLRQFIPTLTGRTQPGDVERELFSLPARLGGLGINNPVLEASENYAASQRLTATLVALIMQQSSEDGAMPTEPATKRQLHFAKRKQQEETAKELLTRLPRHLKRAVLPAKEKDTSSWLSMVPLEEHGFALFKRDAEHCH